MNNIEREVFFMKFVDLTYLPRCFNGNIDWISSIGCKVPFNYKGTIGELLIVDKIKGSEYLLVQHEDNDSYKIKTCHLKDGRIGVVIGMTPPRKKDYIHQVGDIVETNIGKIRITEQIRKPHSEKDSHILRKAYNYKCLICGHEDYIMECNLRAGKGCCVCASNHVSVGINDLSTLAPEVAPYLVDPNDLYRYMPCSNKSVKVCCPFCKTTREVVVSDLTCRGFSCLNCSSGISYPEKFMVSLLKQLGIEFEREVSKKTFKWCGGFRYDFYLPAYDMIIETHGKQHYSHEMYNEPVTKVQLNDQAKKDLACENNISHYIVLNCSHSTVDWIKNSVLNSELDSFFSFDDVGWAECGRFALSNLGLEICNLWNELYTGGLKKTVISIIKEKLGIKSNETVRRYLVKGEELGLCDFGQHKLLERRENRMKLVHQSAELYNLGFSNIEISQKINVDNLYVHRLLKRADELGLIDFTPFRNRQAC